MAINVPVRISQPADKNTVSRLYGSGARITQPMSRGELSRLNRVTSGDGSSPAVNNTLPRQTSPVNAQPSTAPAVNNQPRVTPPVNAQTRVTPPVNAQPSQNSAPSRPAIKRRRAAPAGASLMKGQKWSVGAGGQVPKALKICVGWECSDSRYELDASAFMLGGDGKVPGEEWFIFYGQTESPDKSVSYRSNADNPNAPDDAELIIYPPRISPQVTKIAVCVTIYEAFERRLNFGAVSDLYARIIDDSGRETGRFLLKECSREVTAMVVGELYRYKDEWKFNAVGSGVNRDLAGFCGMYGIDLK